MKIALTTVSFCILYILFAVSSCSDSQTVLQEEDNYRETSVVWDLVTVTGNVVNLRSGPGTIYSVLGQVHEGDSLQVTGGLDNWYRIYAPGMSLFAWIYGPLTSGTELP